MLVHSRGWTLSGVSELEDPTKNQGSYTQGQCQAGIMHMLIRDGIE